MRLKLHQDIEGKKAGQTAEVPEERARFYLAEGYASTSADQDGVHATSVKAKLDPRLAENAGDANRTLGEQHADGLVIAGEPNPDPVPTEPYVAPNPVERTNGEGNPETAEKGKEAAEKAADRTDPSDAVEETA